jgi:hypothetical protein
MKRKAEVVRDTSIGVGDIKVNRDVLASQSSFWETQEVDKNAMTEAATAFMMDYVHQTHLGWDAHTKNKDMVRLWPEVLRLNEAWGFPDETFLQRTASLKLDWHVAVSLLELLPNSMVKVWDSLECDMEWQELLECKCSPITLARVLLSFRKGWEESIATVYLSRFADYVPKENERELIGRVLCVTDMLAEYVRWVLIPWMERHRHLFSLYTGDLAAALQGTTAKYTVTANEDDHNDIIFLVGIPLILTRSGISKSKCLPFTVRSDAILKITSEDWEETVSVRELPHEFEFSRDGEVTLSLSVE